MWHCKDVRGQMLSLPDPQQRRILIRNIRPADALDAVVREKTRVFVLSAPKYATIKSAGSQSTMQRPFVPLSYASLGLAKACGNANLATSFPVRRPTRATDVIARPAQIYGQSSRLATGALPAKTPAMDVKSSEPAMTILTLPAGGGFARLAHEAGWVGCRCVKVTPPPLAVAIAPTSDLPLQGCDKAITCPPSADTALARSAPKITRGRPRLRRDAACAFCRMVRERPAGWPEISSPRRCARADAWDDGANMSPDVALPHSPSC